jgi:plastocyanin
MVPSTGLRYHATQPQTQSRRVTAAPDEKGVVKAELSEWKIALDTSSVAPGRVTFRVHNAGTTAHGFEIEGNGIEKRIGPIAPDSVVTLALDLKTGEYEVYCPLGSGSHKKMGMVADVNVRARK